MGRWRTGRAGVLILAVLVLLGLGGGAALFYTGERPGGEPEQAPQEGPRRALEPEPTGPAIITNSLGMQFVEIPAGAFVMGAPPPDDRRRRRGPEPDNPQHRVELTRPFLMGIHEVTQAQWETVMQSAPWREHGFVRLFANDGPDFPVTYISWNQAVEFCRRLSELEGRAYRLPTEAEWEYACRAGSPSAYTFGDSVADLPAYAVFHPTRERQERDDPHPDPVGQRRPNAWGLFDLHGNVAEWVADWYGPYPASDLDAPTVVDPAGPSSGTRRVIRGGHWWGGAEQCRSDARASSDPAFGSETIGFRVVMEIPSPQTAGEEAHD